MIAALHSFYFYLEILSPFISDGSFTAIFCLQISNTSSHFSSFSQWSCLFTSMKKGKLEAFRREIPRSPITSSCLHLCPYIPPPLLSKETRRACGRLCPGLRPGPWRLRGCPAFSFPWASSAHFTRRRTTLKHKQLLLIRSPFSDPVASLLIFLAKILERVAYTYGCSLFLTIFSWNYFNHAFFLLLCWRCSCRRHPGTQMAKPSLWSLSSWTSKRHLRQLTTKCHLRQLTTFRSDTFLFF